MLTFRYTAHSEIGLVRKNNQDSAYASPRMLMVADGMGGAAAGDLASAVAVEALAATDAELDDRLDQADGRPDVGHELPEGRAGDVLAQLALTLSAANARLNHLVARDPRLDGMGSTVCGLVLVDDETAALVNIGDSRAYLLRDGALTRISRDHSWVQTLVDEGRITEAEALEHPHRSLILRVLNGKPQHEPDLTAVALRPGDRVLVCSDGLCGLVTDAEIAAPAAIADREAAVASLVDLAHEAGGYDNITVVLADVVDGEPEGGPTILGSAGLHPVADAEAAAEASTRAVPAVAGEAERYAPRPRTARTRLRSALAVLLPVVLLAGGGVGWYSYTQTRYYIGPSYLASAPKVALYKGIPDAPFGVPLSHVVTEGVPLGDLPPASVERVTRTFGVDSADAGQAVLAQLRVDADRCVAQRQAKARAGQTAPTQPGPAPSPGPSGGPSPDVLTIGTASAAPSTAITPVAPGEC